MCGIVGAVAQRNVAAILLEGLKRLEYRGYDSAGMAIVDDASALQCVRVQGKVSELSTAITETPLLGSVGIAHTRWATHGSPSIINAHPHISSNQIAVVHNGIIENHEELRQKLLDKGYQFLSDTDTEVVSHLIHYYLQNKDFLTAVRRVADELKGAFSMCIINSDQPDRIIAIRHNSPLVVGLGIDENFIASDQLALTPVAQKIIYLENGDIAEVFVGEVKIYDKQGKRIERPIQEKLNGGEQVDKGTFRHFMAKEIFEQPSSITATLEGRLTDTKVLENIFGGNEHEIFSQVENIQIAACGTSYHAGLVAKYWLEDIAHIPCQVEVASELRYRNAVVKDNTLFIAISQSGETADTLAALRQAKTLGYLGCLAICNVPQSSMVRETDLSFLTHAGMEIGVASTKAFTTQLAALLMLTIVLGRRFRVDNKIEADIVSQLHQLPLLSEQVLGLDNVIQNLAQSFVDKQHALFLGRGMHFPIALEGALKLKELSYIHAEAYPAGELKHGPLALVDKNMPVVAIAPNDELLEKLKSNLQEVRARGGELFVFADSDVKMKNGPGISIIPMPTITRFLTPILYSVPLQLLAYHVAVLKGTDVDQPRNLAKSVTVE